MSGGKLIGALAVVAAAVLAVGSLSALAGPAAGDDGADQVGDLLVVSDGGEADCGADSGSDGGTGEDGSLEPLEFTGAVISASEFGLALRTEGEVVLALYGPDTVFEDFSGEAVSRDQVVQGVDALLLAVSTDNPTWFEAILVRLLGDVGGDGAGGETDGDANCGDDGGGSDGDAGGDETGDTEGDADGDTGSGSDGDGEADAAFETLSHGVGPNVDRGCANGSVEHAREVLEALLEKDQPGESEGIQNALDKMCHGFFASEAGSLESGDGGGDDSEAHPGNRHAFGRSHGQGKPEGVPKDGGGE